MDSLKKPETHSAKWIEAERELIAKGLFPRPLASLPIPSFPDVPAPNVVTPDSTVEEEDLLRARGKPNE